MDIWGRWLDFYALMPLLGSFQGVQGYHSWFALLPFLICKDNIPGVQGYHSKVDQERREKNALLRGSEDKFEAVGIH